MHEIEKFLKVVVVVVVVVVVPAFLLLFCCCYCCSIYVSVCDDSFQQKNDLL